MKKKIIIFSTSRSDFGILSPLIKLFEIKKKIDHHLILGGDHLLSKKRLNLIKSNFKVSKFLKFYSHSNYNYKNFCKSMSSLNLKLEKIFNSLDFEYVLILGDRSELIPIVHHSIMNKKKIIHIGGGEYTYGAIDNDIRYMVSQIAHMHFTMHKNYKSNLINLVKDNSKIFNVGYLGLDELKKIKKNKVKKQFLLSKFNIQSDNYVLFTYHPSLEEVNKKTIHVLKKILFSLIKSKYTVVATHPGMEFRNNHIKMLYNNLKLNKYFIVFPNLGSYNYLNLLKNSKCIIGNSSSGLIEAPYFKIPTINIGNRQYGRIRHESVIDCELNYKEFEKMLNRLNNEKFKNRIRKMKYQFGENTISKKIYNYILRDD